ncbi:unnamed protein product [Larinioides sclopetarius]|uniref:Uncharacterized protein n=1 Tax=Larinioides sclopetarius TaxID=280406 RepID=A0AAV2A6V2_9ARAC
MLVLTHAPVTAMDKKGLTSSAHRYSTRLSVSSSALCLRGSRGLYLLL